MDIINGPLTDKPNHSTMQTLPPKKMTPPNNEFRDEGATEGPSWGLIIPILMIGVFLTGVVLCLWWHKWRDKRIQRSNVAGTSFQRSYRGNRSGFDTIRDSTRSTLPLRSSVNEKIANNNNSVTNNNNIKVSNANNVSVIPVQRSGSGKYSFYWDKNHWRACPTSSLTASGRMGTKPLSPINEIDSPTSFKISEASLNYDVHAQPPYSPYHLTWSASSNAPPSYEQSEKTLYRDGSRYPPPVRRSSIEFPVVNQTNVFEPAVHSPFHPNNNTPTTECDTGSETSHNRYSGHGPNNRSSQSTSYQSNPLSNTVLSVSNTRLCISSDVEGNGTSYETSFPETSYQTSQSHSGFQTLPPSEQTSATDQPSTNISSLPSSIAQFSKQNLLLEDPNNNSMIVPNSYISFPLSKALNYTLASSIASSDTHFSDNTSMVPNMGSNNTSDYPTLASIHTNQISTEQNVPASPEDLSKLVDEMSSIRPVDESSSMRPNSSVEPTSKIVSISGNSISADLHSSWSVVADMQYRSLSSVNTNSQVASQNDLSLYWDNYPLNSDQALAKSYPNLPLHLQGSQQSFADNIQPLPHLLYRAPILMEKQYWV